MPFGCGGLVVDGDEFDLAALTPRGGVEFFECQGRTSHVAGAPDRGRPVMLPTKPTLMVVS